MQGYTPLVKKGNFVAAGTQLGLVGNTGKSQGTHLHYSVYTRARETYAANVMANIFGAGFLETSMANSVEISDTQTITTKTVYDPLGFYNKYKGKYQLAGSK